MPGDRDNAVLRKTLGGMCGGLCEALALHPLDTIKTRLQLAGRQTSLVATQPKVEYKGIVDCAMKISRSEGFFSLYKGLSPFTLHLVSKYCLRFYTNFKIRELISGGTGQTTLAQNMLAGACAGTIEALVIVTPFEVVKTRLQAQQGAVVGPNGQMQLKYKGPIHAVGRILRKEGPQGMWKGCSPTVFRQATNQMSMFASYTFLRKALWGQSDTTTANNLAPWQAAITGLIAATVGPMFNCPADVIKTRLMNQTNSMVEPGMRYKGFADAFKRIAREEGVPALYKGIVPRLARLAPGQAITWMAVEKFNVMCNDNGLLL